MINKLLFLLVVANLAFTWFACSDISRLMYYHQDLMHEKQRTYSTELDKLQDDVLWLKKKNGYYAWEQ